MIRLTRFDGSVFVLNSEIIQYMEATPDTILTLTSGDKLMVRESVDEVIERVLEFKRLAAQQPVVLQKSDTEDVVE